MALDLTPYAFKRRVAVAMDRATPGTKRMLGYAAMSDGIGERYEIRLLRNGAVRATYTMTGKLPYSLSTGLAPTATLIASVTQAAAIDVADGATWTVQVASTVNAGWMITGTLGASGTDFTLGGAAPPSPPASTDIGPVGQVAANWSRTFTEEFDGGTLDSSKWLTQIWYGDDGNDGTVNYDTNASSNSCLRIWPALNGSGNFFNRTINTDGKFSQLYGFFEARMKLPTGRGCWPAFWLFAHPGSLRPEVDIMEAYNGGASTGWSTDAFEPNNFAASMHLPSVLASQGPYKLSDTLGAQRLDTDFHVYGCKWTSSTISVYFDGQLLVERAFAIPYEMFLLVDLWFGSAAGTPNVTDTPRGSSNALTVDYVRAWQAV